MTSIGSWLSLTVRHITLEGIGTTSASSVPCGPVAIARRAAEWARPTPFSCFVNLRKSEAEGEQSVLLAHGPRAGKGEAVAQPQHGLEALDGAPRRGEGLKAANPRHGPLDPEVVALDPLLQVLW